MADLDAIEALNTLLKTISITAKRPKIIYSSELVSDDVTGDLDLGIVEFGESIDDEIQIARTRTKQRSFIDLTVFGSSTYANHKLVLEAIVSKLRAKNIDATDLYIYEYKIANNGNRVNPISTISIVSNLLGVANSS